MARWVLLLVIAACSSGRGAGATPHPRGAPPVTADPAACAGVRARVEQLYRADAEQREPMRIDEAVSDNTTMVMNDCTKEPARIVPCLSRASSVAELEAQCVIPLDDEGSEGELVAR